ncbi:MAG: hypothetical protein R2741_14210 [Methanolobus sp.]
MAKDFPVKLWVTVTLIAILIISNAILFENQSENDDVQTEVTKQVDETQIDNTSSQESAEEIEITEYTFENYGGEIYTPDPMDFGANLINGNTPEDASIYNETERKHLLLQIYANATNEQILSLEEYYGIKIIDLADDHTYLVSMAANLTAADLPAESGLRWMGEIPIENKYDTTFGLNVPKWAWTETGQVEIEIHFYEDVTSQEAKILATNYSSSIPQNVAFTYVVYIITTEEENLALIANEDIVQRIVFPSPGSVPD